MFSTLTSEEADRVEQLYGESLAAVAPLPDSSDGGRTEADGT